jgi:hypothetical protein
MQVRNITAIDGGRYDCEVEHPRFGWIPYTADANDPEPLGRALHAEIEAVGEQAMQIADLRFVDAAGTIAGVRPDGTTVFAAPGSDENKVARTGVLGPVAAWVASPPSATLDRRRERAWLDRVDFARALRRLNMVTHAEAMKFLSNGTPKPIAAMINALPADLRADAEFTLAGSHGFERSLPLWQDFVQAGVLTDAQLDDLFGLTD